MPISDLAILNEIQILLDLAELMGNLQGQLNPGIIKKVNVECAGSMHEAKPAALAFLKGLLKGRVPDRVNYINAETLAVELGIKIEYSYSSDCGTYTNLIRTKVQGELVSNEIHGSIFEGKRIRLVNILGYEIDVTPYGTMLFARNKDVPGVIGKVGTMLGEAKINIGAYLLSREMNNGEAFAVMRVDNSVPEDILLKLEELPEILSVQQLHC